MLAIPLTLSLTSVGSSWRVGGIRLAGVFTWVEICWLALWFCKLVAQAFPIKFQATCGLISTGIRKYSFVLKALEIPTASLPVEHRLLHDHECHLRFRSECRVEGSWHL